MNESPFFVRRTQLDEAAIGRDVVEEPLLRLNTILSRLAADESGKEERYGEAHRSPHIGSTISGDPR